MFNSSLDKIMDMLEAELVARQIEYSSAGQYARANGIDEVLYLLTMIQSREFDAFAEEATSKRAKAMAEELMEKRGY